MIKLKRIARPTIAILSDQFTWKMEATTAMTTSVNATAIYPPVVDSAAQIDLTRGSF